jgi:hypothetical protein
VRTAFTRASTSDHAGASTGADPSIWPRLSQHAATRSRAPARITTQGGDMTRIHFNQKTTLTPAHYIAGLTDFGPGRSKVFSNSADDYLKVHHVGTTEADVTEGSGGVWERLHYDWSDPDRIVLKTTDSNVWGGASGYTYTFTSSPDGVTDVDVVIVREGKNAKGRVLAFALGTVGKGVLGKAFTNSIRAIEARDRGARAG